MSLSAEVPELLIVCYSSNEVILLLPDSSDYVRRILKSTSMFLFQSSYYYHNCKKNQIRWYVFILITWLNLAKLFLRSYDIDI